MPFNRYVETGRVAVVSDGPSKGKLVTVVDCIDQTRVLIDGPETGVHRTQIRLNQLQLTKFRMRFPFTAPTSMVRKVWKESEIDKKWAETMWSEKQEAKKKRATLTDFDRFKLRHARSRRNRIRTETFLALRKTAARNGTLFGKKKMAKGGNKPLVKKGKKAPVAAEPKKPKAAPKK